MEESGRVAEMLGRQDLPGEGTLAVSAARDLSLVFSLIILILHKRDDVSGGRWAGKGMREDEGGFIQSRPLSY